MSYVEVKSPKRLENFLNKASWLERDQSRICNPKHLSLLTWEILKTNHKNPEVWGGRRGKSS